MHRLDLGQCAAPVSDINELGITVVANIVRVIEVGKGFEEVKSCAVEDFERAISTTGDIKTVAISHIEQTGGFLHSAQSLSAFAIAQIDHLDCIVAEGGDEKAFPFDING